MLSVPLERIDVSMTTRPSRIHLRVFFAVTRPPFGVQTAGLWISTTSQLPIIRSRTFN